MNLRATSTWSTCWTYDSYFVCIKLPVDGSLVPIHVGVGTWYEVFCDICLLYFNYWILLVKVYNPNTYLVKSKILQSCSLSPDIVKENWISVLLWAWMTKFLSPRNYKELYMVLCALTFRQLRPLYRTGVSLFSRERFLYI